MRDPIVQRAITENLLHTPYKDGVGSGDRPVTVEVVKFAKDRARQAELTQPLPPAPRVTVKEPAKAPSLPRARRLQLPTALKELWVITAVQVERHALELLCVAVVLYTLVALQLVGDTILLALFCGATEILARGYKRAHLWSRYQIRGWLILRRRKKLHMRLRLKAAKALPLPSLTPPGTRFNCSAHFVRARRCHCLPRLQTPPGLRIDGIAGTFYVLLGAGVAFDTVAFIHRIWS